MERNARSKFNTQIYEEACEWFVECRGSDLDDAARREFDRWLRKSPEHLSAYLEIAAIWNEAPSLDYKWNVETLIVQVTEDHDNVVPISSLALGDSGLRSPHHMSEQESTVSSGAGPPVEAEGSITGAGEESTRSVPSLQPQRKSSKTGGLRAGKWPPFTLAASIAVVCVVTGTLIWSQAFRLPTYATAVGEQRSIVLTDGSTVELNSRSKVKVSYSERARAVELVEGQALFRVAKDPARPFIVTSDGTQVRAVGTQFDVYKKRTGTVVTVVEGRVAILTSPATSDAVAQDSLPPVRLPPANREGKPEHPAGSADPLALDMSEKVAKLRNEALTPQSGGAAAIFLSAGEQLTVTHETVQKTVHPNIEGATAWRQRQLVFESASLVEVAEEFNRYNERQLIVEDAELYDFHISGVFSSTDPASLIRFLRERPGVRVIETASEVRVEKNSPQRG